MAENVQHDYAEADSTQDDYQDQDEYLHVPVQDQDDEVQIVRERLTIQAIIGFRVHPRRGPQLKVRMRALPDPVWMALRTLLNDCPLLTRMYFDQPDWPLQPVYFHEE